MAAAMLVRRLGVFALNSCSKFSGGATGSLRCIGTRYLSSTSAHREDRWFTANHEFIDISGTVGTVGITDYAQKELGDVVFVDLPRVGTKLEKDVAICTMESVKAVAEVFAPLSGVVSEVNDRLVTNPGLINTSPYDEGWLVKLSLTQEEANAAAKLMDSAAYDKYLKDH